MGAPVSRIEHNTKISVVSRMDDGFARDAAGDVVEMVPSILIAAEFHGLWDSPTDRDAEMQRTVDALMASYKAHVTQLSRQDNALREGGGQPTTKGE